MTRLVLAAAAALASFAAHADPAFETPDPDYRGHISARNSEPAQPFLPGATLNITGQGFKPGQEVSFGYGLTPLLPKPLVADAKGDFATTYQIPADAPVGSHPVVIVAKKPYHLEIVDLKISPQLPLSGQEAFALHSAKLVPGVYEAALGRDGIYVTAAEGYPPIKSSELLRLDRDSLAITARTAPPAAPDGGLFAVYGLATDNSNGTIWVTNTRHDTVSVYAQDDMALIRQFDAGLVPHARDVLVDDKRGKVYVSANTAAQVAVFDAKRHEFIANIKLASLDPREDFSPAGLALDEAQGTLYVTDLATPEIAVIDTASGKLRDTIPVPGAKGLIGIAFDPASKRLFLAAQGSDSLVILDPARREVLHSLPIGAGPLNVAIEPQTGLAYVASRGAGTVTVVDAEGRIVANLPVAPFANHVLPDERGGVLALNKALAPEDDSGDRITRIKRK